MIERSNAKWFRVDDVGYGVWRIQETGLGPLYAANIWLAAGRDRALLIDTGVGVASLRPVVKDITDQPMICMLTHSHYDHIGGGWEFPDRWAHPAEAAVLANPTPEATMWRGWLTDAVFNALPDPEFSVAGYKLNPARPSRLVEHGEIVDLGDRSLTILHTPGHSPGLITLYEAATGILFTSDALYDGRMFFNLPGSDNEAAISSVGLLASLPVSIVHPGHGASYDGARLLRLAEETIRNLRLTTTLSRPSRQSRLRVKSL